MAGAAASWSEDGCPIVAIVSHWGDVLFAVGGVHGRSARRRRHETEMIQFHAKPLKCEKCGRSVTVRQLIRGASDYWGAVNVVISETPCCHSREELRLATGKVMRGHVYAAGGPRFRVTDEWEAPIRVRRWHHELSVELGTGQSWIPARE